jgi:transposase
MDEKEKRIAELEEEIRKLKEIITALIAENAELKARLNKNSKNSNKPPSSDGYKKGKVKNSRVASGRQSGGQPGHEGFTKLQTPTPTKIIVLSPGTQCECGGEIHEETEQYTPRQVMDIEPIQQVTVEYRAHSGVCAKCGKVHKGTFPEHINAPVTYGENLQTVVTYLSVYQLLPLKRTTELVADLTGVDISQSTVISAAEEAYENLAETEARIKEEIIDSEVVHFDESGARVNSETQWLHTAGTEDCTLYTIHKSRGKEAMDEMGVLPVFTGTAVHDHWKSYYGYGQCAHAECNEHHLRTLKYLHENLGEAWAKDMAVLLLRIKKHVDLSKLFEADQLLQQDIDLYGAMYRAILEDAAVKAESRPIESQRMIKRLTKYEQEALLFMLDFSVPFTNNLAERDIRMPKVKQKISGCFRSEEGAKRFARIRGFVSTVKKRGLKVINGLHAVFTDEATDFLFPNPPCGQGSR